MANKRLNAIIQIGGAVAGSLGAAIGQVRNRIGSVGGAIAQVESRQRELNRVITEGNRAGTASAAMRSQYAQQELAALDKKLARLRNIGAIEQRMTAAKSRVMDAGLQLGGIIAAASPLALASKKAGEFEYQLQLIGNTADMTKAEIAALSAQVLETSKSTGQSADNTVRGIGFLVAAGMDVKTAAETVKQAGLAATASGGDIEDLARAAFTLNDSLKIPAGRAMLEALDTLAQAGKEGNVELKDMAKQLPALGAGFVSLKMQGREAAATMAAALEVARKGAADADEAANNMKNYIAKVMSPETLKKAKKTFGIDLYKIISDAQTKGENPFEASMRAIMKATKGDQKAIGELFQDMQVQNFLRPMIQNWEEYERIKKKALGASSVIDRDAEKMRQTQKQQVDEAMNAISRMAIAIGSVLAPAVSAVANAITPLVSSLSVWISENRELAGNIATLGGVLIGWLAGTKLVSIGLGAVTLAFNALKLAMMTNPLGAALVLLTTAAVMIYKNWEPLKAFFVNLWDGIVAAFKGGIDWIVGKIEWVASKFQAIKSSLFAGGDPDAQRRAQAEYASQQAAAAALPTPKPAMRGAANYTDQSSTTIHVTQQPGQNARQLAEEITRLQEQQRAARQRGRLADGLVGAQ